METTNCLIIGSGPAGYTAAIYASRANLKPIVIEGLQSGGQLTQTTTVENFPGFPDGIEGYDLMEDMRSQAEKYGADIRYGIATDVDLSAETKVITLDDGTQIAARTVIIATGASAKFLGLDCEKRYIGRGVSACATCDGFFFKGKKVMVVGGGDTALGDAIYLSGLAESVTLIVRKDHFRASRVLVERAEQTANIHIMFHTELHDIEGEKKVERVIVKHNETHQLTTLDIDGVFVAIGHHPNTEIFAGKIDLDATGHIITDGMSQQTNVEGVFAAGDVCDPLYKQAIVAAGSGCRAALDAERYLMSKE